MTFRIEKRFGIADAERVRSTLHCVGPVSEVAIDLSATSVVEDAALLVLANLMNAMPGCRFRLSGLTHHRRRMLRYMGVHGALGARPAGADVQDAAGEPATAA